MNADQRKTYRTAMLVALARLTATMGRYEPGPTGAAIVAAMDPRPSRIDAIDTWNSLLNAELIDACPRRLTQKGIAALPAALSQHSDAPKPLA